MTRMRRALVAALTVAVAWPGAAPASNPTPEQAFAELNHWRAQAGVPALTALDATLSEGCRLHNAYLSKNLDVRGLDRHREVAGRPGYTELGARAGELSNLSGEEGGPRAWDSPVYHRMGLLDPTDTTAWFDASSSSACMGASGDRGFTALALYPWPADGLRGVPLEFGNGEHPSPYDSVPEADQLGYLLSVNVSVPGESRLSGASLTPDGGAPVAVTGVDAGSVHGGYLNGGFAIFPHRPLKPRTWYTAHATGEVRSGGAVHAFDLGWRFMTGTRNGGTYVSTDSHPGELLISVPGHKRAMVTVTRDGAVVARRSVRHEGRWRPRIPAGEYRACVEQPLDEYVGDRGCASWAHLRLSGNLRGRRVKVRLSVPPVGTRRRVRVSVDAVTRTCYRLGNGRRWCGRRQETVAKRVVRVRRGTTLGLKIPRRARRIEVRATAPAVTVRGERHVLAISERVMRRRASG